MRNITRSITVRWTYEGWHKWPEAHSERNYLADSHRHLFYVELTVEVQHNDREVEFHDLLTYAKGLLPSGEDFGRKSCEDMANEILEYVNLKYPDRNMLCSVWEDNEVGATIRWEQF